MKTQKKMKIEGTDQIKERLPWTHRSQALKSSKCTRETHVQYTILNRKKQPENKKMKTRSEKLSKKWYKMVWQVENSEKKRNGGREEEETQKLEWEEDRVRMI